MPNLNLAVIGNCSYGALIDQVGRVCWACLPHFDGDPFFCSLLNGQHDDDGFGFYDIVVDNFVRSQQEYVQNTAILVTRLYDTAGSAVEITDFAPRFKQFGRHYRPTMLVRQVRPIQGTPRIRIRLRPAYQYGSHRPERSRGSNHIRFITPDLTLRLTTNAPLSFVFEEIPFVLEKPLTLVLGPDESLTRSTPEVGREYFESTNRYWREFSRYLSIPFEWQDAVIRAAITLKLCSFDDSGAIIAAMTTSIPEAPDSGRNWDYRYCWLRDAYFVVHALNRLGATGTLERFLGYITNIAASAHDGYLQPVYGIDLNTQLPERLIDSLPGYRSMGPVRVGNQAYEQTQNDGYGSAILAVTQSFFDQRLARTGSKQLFHWLEKLGEQAANRYNQPDSSIWELRGRKSIHTHSSVMCWAACDRLAKIAAQLGLPARAKHWRRQADEIRSTILKEAWNDKLQSFAASFGGSHLDASLLLLNELGFLDANDPRFAKTVAAIEKELRHDGRIFRYAHDDYGAPETTFLVCNFWYIDALAALGRREEARELFDSMLACRNHVGLLSEDLAPTSGELWGNFPQTYSMVGLVHSAMQLSKPWEEAF